MAPVLSLFPYFKHVFNFFLSLPQFIHNPSILTRLTRTIRYAYTVANKSLKQIFQYPAIDEMIVTLILFCLRLDLLIFCSILCLVGNFSMTNFPLFITIPMAHTHELSVKCFLSFDFEPYILNRLVITNWLTF